MSSKTRRARGARSGTARAAASSEATYPQTAPAPSRPAARRTNRLLLLGGLAVIVLAVVGLAFFGQGLLSIGVKPVPATYSTKGRISFVRQSTDGKKDLFVINPDGTHQEQVTQDISIEGTNAWSPDGRRVLLQASVGGTSTVVRIDIGPDNKPSNAVQLTADKKADSVFPAWSPDGARIAFQSKRDGGDYQVFIMDADGNNKRRLSDGKGYASQPVWSPDGTTILYRAGAKSDPGSPKELYIVSAAGGAPKQLTSQGKDISSPQWSPDGKSIMYVENKGDRLTVIHIVNAGGTAPRTLVNEGANLYPHFSPDGQKLAYYAIGATGSNVYVVPTSGGATSNITHLSQEAYQPAWSPDGSRLVWSSKGTANYKIVVGDVSGLNQRVISNGLGDDYQPEWGAPVK
jgi:Tol biopolymer transport system component